MSLSSNVNEESLVQAASARAFPRAIAEELRRPCAAACAAAAIAPALERRLVGGSPSATSLSLWYDGSLPARASSPVVGILSGSCIVLFFRDALLVVADNTCMVSRLAPELSPALYDASDKSVASTSVMDDRRGGRS